ncbi:hypothetical protein BM1_04083 [Bipolaris maydis]|nr:hypothetical protein BM1_04083 [Bipolaris maydis]
MPLVLQATSRRIHSPGMTMVSWETTWDPDGKDGHRGARSRDVPSRQDGAISDGRTLTRRILSLTSDEMAESLRTSTSEGNDHRGAKIT